MNFDTDDTERFEQELADTDVKAILLGIHAELVQLRMAVEGSESKRETYVCDDCHDSFATAEGLRSHAVDAHNAPPGMDTHDSTEKA